MNWLKEIFSGTIGATGAITIREIIAALGKKGHEIVIKKIEDLIKDNPRADLLYILLAMDPADATTLWQRHLGAIASGTENAFARILGQALPRDKDGKIDIERAKKIFSQIAQMDEARFCQVMEELNHDPIAQHIRHWLKYGANFSEALLEGIAYGAGVATRWGQQIDQRAEQLADEITEGTQDRRNASWFSRLASRLP
jgi:hypothetical protein